MFRVVTVDEEMSSVTMLGGWELQAYLGATGMRQRGSSTQRYWVPICHNDGVATATMIALQLFRQCKAARRGCRGGSSKLCHMSAVGMQDTELAIPDCNAMPCTN